LSASIFFFWGKALIEWGDVILFICVSHMWSLLSLLHPDSDLHFPNQLPSRSLGLKGTGVFSPLANWFQVWNLGIEPSLE
jgi:hypothetical protein